MNEIHKQQARESRTGNGKFNILIPFGVPSTAILEKEVGGVKRKILQGIASSTSVDRDNDVVTKEFLAKMRKQALGLTVFKEHNWNIDATLGYIGEIGGDDNTLIVDTVLEPEETNPEVTKILNKLDHGTRLGYSIGGVLTKTKKVKSADGTMIRQLIDGDLYEVSVTAMPANTDTWVTALEKSLVDFPDGDEGDATETHTTQESPVMEKSTSKDEALVKILDDVLESDKLHNLLYDLFWAFKGIICQVVYDDNLTPEQKRVAIETTSVEFGAKVETISAQLAALVESVANDLAGEVPTTTEPSVVTT